MFFIIETSCIFDSAATVKIRTYSDVINAYDVNHMLDMVNGITYGGQLEILLAQG
jgi:hypothetical protein